MSFRAVLSNRGFRALWGAQVVSKLGDSVHEIALIFLAYQVTGSPTLVAAVVVASVVPSAVLSPVAGALVDRVNRKWVLIGTQLARGVAVLAIPLVGRGGPVIRATVAVAFVAGLMEALASPARSSVVPNLVADEELEAANGLSRMTNSAARLLYAAGGAAVALVGPFGAFYVDAATFLLSAGVLAFVPTAACRPDREAGESDEGLGTELVADVREGVRFVRGEPVLLTLLVLSGVTAFALAPFGIVLPFFAETVLGVERGSGAVTFGSLYTALYVGIFVGGAVVGGLAERLTDHRKRVVLLGVFVTGLGLVATALGPLYLGRSVFVAGAGLAVTGAAISAIQVPVSSIAQATVPDERRGRVFSLMSAPALLAPPASVALVGPLLDLYGAVPVLLGEAAVMVLLAVGLASVSRWSGVRRGSAIRTGVAALAVGSILAAPWLVGWVDPPSAPLAVALGVAGAVTTVVGVAVERTGALDRLRSTSPILGRVVPVAAGVAVALATSVAAGTALSVTIGSPVSLAVGGAVGVLLGLSFAL